MEMIASFVGLPLQWGRTRPFKAEYELKSGEVSVAGLRFRSVWSTLATAQSADGCWTFRRVGFWVTRTTICPCNCEEPIALFENNTGSGGTLLLSDGRQYPANITYANWRPAYELQTEAREPLIYYRPHGTLSSSAEVAIFPKAQELSELPWMVMLGWYLTVMVQRDAGSTG